MKKILTLIATAFLAISAQAGEYPDISIKEKKVTILDVNGSESYAQAHIPGAIDFTAKKEHIASVLPSDKSALVVAYCGGPTCGAYAAAAKKASELGYTNVKHLSVGISGWQEARQPTEAK